MDTVEKVALTVLTIVLVLVILQRAQGAAQVVNAIGSQFAGVVRTLVSAPR
jgi:nitrate/nitrite-specific signal transduction histidine kinase